MAASVGAPILLDIFGGDAEILFDLTAQLPAATEYTVTDAAVRAFLKVVSTAIRGAYTVAQMEIL